MTQPNIICVAPLGAWCSRDDHPATPISPREIADAVVECASAGAAIAHLHARDADGKPTQDLEIYRDIHDRIKQRSDIIVQLSTGTRGMTVQQALEPVTLAPEMASLALRDVGPQQGTDVQRRVVDMAKAMIASGVCPEFDASDAEMIDRLNDVCASLGDLSAPCVGLFLKDEVSAQAAARHILALVAKLPAAAHWWAAKGGANHALVQTLALGLGGHCRVGFEDSLLGVDGQPVKSNADLVERVAQLGARVGRPAATPAQAREILGLKSA
ncbi:3-keto-5-aminohexanoate cleavage protein [Oceaniglobus ichthyenteri]|uniref:3-keto-5-aminohexanoate cleavage protein n=1 Tax=Oceaniglobus ichthyenteri TaxID=2136177 RepID=UPI0013DE535D|nr:3-keto-5-aminohexanoate cleavage protein [Oceaniglobus ichthyenteri]